MPGYQRIVCTSQNQIFKAPFFYKVIHVMCDSKLHYFRISQSVFYKRHYSGTRLAVYLNIRVHCSELFSVDIAAYCCFSCYYSDFFAAFTYHLFDCRLNNTDYRNSRIALPQCIKCYRSNGIARDDYHFGVSGYQIVDILFGELYDRLR